ncbi:hypothetical protein [Sphingobium lactosutens]|uniref:hypothetical protein n=1 Tax=Sphingobium lactosutens TaxID=522773 RepID=UPI0015BBDF5F|nr:hypothetical protein [Sphingobium lactosutens]
MLKVIASRITKRDLKHLARRLDNIKGGEAIRGGWELAVLWALMSEFGDDADPCVEQRQSGRPDCRVNLDIGQKLMLEVYAPTGDTFEFKSVLAPITQSFYDMVDRVSPNSSQYLYVNYHEWSKPVAGGSMRVPSVANTATQDIRVVSQLERFWRGSDESIRITAHGVIDATFTRMPYRYNGLNYRCQIPRQPQSVTNNLTGQMVEKSNQQLMPFRDDHLLGLVVCDGGMEVLSNARGSSGQGTPSFASISQQTFASSGIDFIVSISRQDRMQMDGFVMSPLNRSKELAIDFFFADTMEVQMAFVIRDALEPALRRIPVPLRHPYQAKSLQSQYAAGATMKPPMRSPACSSNSEEFRIKVSARALVDLMTGRIEPEEFRKSYLSNTAAILDTKVLNGVSMTHDEDYDDDYVEFSVAKDDLRTKFSDIARNLT